MANGIRMRPHPTTFSLGGIHLAIAEGLLCLRVEDKEFEAFVAICTAPLQAENDSEMVEEALDGPHSQGSPTPSRGKQDQGDVDGPRGLQAQGVRPRDPQPHAPLSVRLQASTPRMPVHVN